MEALMIINIQAPRIRSAETPREIIAADFKQPSGSSFLYLQWERGKHQPEIIRTDFRSLNGELPITGGWGYDKSDAVVIDKKDPCFPQDTTFNVASIEYIFVEKRLYEELIIFQSEESKYSGIQWNLINQKLMTYGKEKYDVLSFEVTAVLDILKEEWEKNNKRSRYVAEYWFDITSIYELVNEKVVFEDENVKHNSKKVSFTTGNKTNKYNLIENFFSPESAIKFFVQLKELRIANEDTSCIAILKKTSNKKWTYTISYNGEFLGEHLKPFKPSKLNVDKFNDGCKKMAEQLAFYMDTGDELAITTQASPFGDMLYEETDGEI